jgi:hypothetical protein
MNGYYPESAERDPRAPWNDDSPDFYCEICGWSSKEGEPQFISEDGEDWICPQCREVHVH